MKKIILYTSIILLLTIAIVGGTYAFFAAGAGSKSPIDTTGHKFEVIYTGGTHIDGPLTLVSNKDNGMNTTVNIKVAEDSVLGKANIYLQIEEITENIATDALRWEVYKNGETTAHSQGTFTQCGTTANQICANDDKLYLVKDYNLSKNNTSFTVYIWLDGNKAGNEVIGASFKGYIGAESENITGNLK